MKDWLSNYCTVGEITEHFVPVKNGAKVVIHYTNPTDEFQSAITEIRTIAKLICVVSDTTIQLVAPTKILLLDRIKDFLNARAS